MGLPKTILDKQKTKRLKPTSQPKATDQATPQVVEYESAMSAREVVHSELSKAGKRKQRKWKRRKRQQKRVEVVGRLGFFGIWGGLYRGGLFREVWQVRSCYVIFGISPVMFEETRSLSYLDSQKPSLGKAGDDPKLSLDRSRMNFGKRTPRLCTLARRTFESCVLKSSVFPLGKNNKENVA